MSEAYSFLKWYVISFFSVFDFKISKIICSKGISRKKNLIENSFVPISEKINFFLEGLFDLDDRLFHPERILRPFQSIQGREDFF